MNKGITLSLNPSYLCNLRCEFCYLSKEQLGNPQTIHENRLFEILSDISARRTIEQFDVYGGEVSMIPAAQMLTLLNTAKLFYAGRFNIISNFTQVPEYFFRDDVTISVSWDYTARARHEQVYKNMLEFKKPLHILMLATEPLLKLDQTEISRIIELLNAIPTLETFEIKPYSKSQYNAYENNFSSFETWVQKWIDMRPEMNFDFINVEKIISSHKSLSSSWSDDHLYIRPDGALAVLDFDQNGSEYFQAVDNFEEYEKWCSLEKEKFQADKVCGSCKYLGRCLSEHLQIVSTDGQSCSGFFNLLERNQTLAGEYDRSI